MENLDSKMLKAALNGNLTTVEELVVKRANINYTDAWGNFVAFPAAWDDNTKALDLFYSLGAKISFENANLLCNTAYNGKIDSVKWLLNKGEDAKFFFYRYMRKCLALYNQQDK